MKTLELEKMGLVQMTIAEMRDSDGGGMLLNLSSVVAEGARFIVGEVADFVQGIIDGYQYVRNK